MEWDPKMMLSTLTATGGVVVMLWQGGSFVESRYAHQEDLIVLAMQVQQQQQTAWVQQLQARIWTLEDRYGGPGVPQASAETKQEYRKLQADLADAQRKLDRTEERMGK